MAVILIRKKALVNSLPAPVFSALLRGSLFSERPAVMTYEEIHVFF